MFFRKQQSIGIDLGDLSVKIAAIEQNKHGFVLKTWTEIPLASGIIVGGQAMANYKIQTGIVVSALPEAKTFLKLISINRGNSLEQSLKQELPKHIPYSPDEVMIDWSEITTNTTTSLTLTGATPTTFAKDYCQALKSAGLALYALDIEAIAIARALIKTPTSLSYIPKNSAFWKEQGTLIIDIGGTKSSIIIAVSDVPIFTYDARAEANSLTKRISEKLKIDTNAAEEMKQTYGTSDNGPSPYKTIVNEYCQTLTGRIHNALEVYSHEYSEAPAISEILLSGGGSLLGGLAQYLMNTLKLKVRLGNPFVNLSAATPPITADNAVRFTTAIGLALYGIEELH
ncbi:MAG: Cell division protein ftsA [Parcubacteria group bacterium GW2011_GWC2_45_7]|nr:MAG: Cell division protein ftsA [Parcubacteria group bacterium GW2011_GWC2_45_7]